MKINLLYNKLGQKNGEELSLNHWFFDFGALVSSFNRIHEPIRLDINNVEIDNNKTYFYAISPGTIAIDDLFREANPIIPENAFNIIQKHKNIFIIINTEHEPIFPHQVKVISGFAKKYQIEKKLIIMTNAFGAESVFNEINPNIRHIKLHFLDYSNYDINKELLIGKIKTKKDGKLFICRNRGAKEHRLGLIYMLLKNNYMDEVNYSYIPERIPYSDSLWDMKRAFHLVLSDLEIEKYYSELLKLVKTYKIDDYEKEYGLIKENQSGESINEFNNSHIQNPVIFRVPELPICYKESYINIVTESNYMCNEIIHPTEKSFRPFVHYQLPLFVASYNHVKYFRDVYEFDMFDDIINHSYDEEIDNKKRIKMITEEIGRLISIKEDIKEFYIKNTDRFEKNREKFFNVSKELFQKEFKILENIK